MAISPHQNVDAANSSFWLRQWLNVAIAFLVLDIFFVIMRYVARRVVKKTEWWWDEFCIGPALLANIVFICLYIYTIHEDFNAVTGIRPPQERRKFSSSAVRGIYGIQLSYVPSYVFPKLSILFLYLRIFPGTSSNRLMRTITWSLVIFMLIDGIAFFVPGAMLCVPINTFWFAGSGWCIDNDAYNRAIPAPNIVTDLVMLLLPVPAVWRLKASLTRRIGIMFTFATGCLGLIASAVRWSYFLRYSVHSSSPRRSDIATRYLGSYRAQHPPESFVAFLRPIPLQPGSQRTDDGKPPAGSSREVSAKHSNEPYSGKPTDQGLISTAGKRTSQYESDMEKGWAQTAHENGKVVVKKDLWMHGTRMDP